MAEPAPRPTANELEELTQAFRRDPGSVFVQLGRAYLALGRPRDTIEVGARGLKANPQHIEGRVMVAQAFTMLHQWKEAQAELLKVVKADRNNGFGFRMLGEVLMRRADYERALPVLQHAQNLLPADPAVLSLLRRARAGQPLDPPPPIPTPMSPSGGAAAGAPAGPGASGPSDLDDMPTKVAGEVYQQSAQEDGAERLARMELKKVRRNPNAPIESVRHTDGRGDDGLPPPGGPAGPPQPPPPPAGGAAAQSAASGAAPASRGGQPAGAGQQPAVRPRVLPVEKPKDAAQASLRQSAAVGEQYLNNLLTAGMLDVPNVQAKNIDYEVKADKRWGRSAARMFIYLFVLLFLGVGGAGTWYWYAEKQKAEDVARLLSEANALVDTGSYADLKKGIEAARDALEMDQGNPYAIAVYAENTGLSVLLYREIAVTEVQRAIDLIVEDVSDPGDEGYRELLVARAGATLSSLYRVEDRDDAMSRLREIRRDLDAWLETSPEDHLIRWLQGRAMQMAGESEEAKAAFEKAQGGGEGPVMATIDLADMLLDQGKFEEAVKLYDQALERAPEHQLAFVGRALARSERSAEAQEAMDDLSVGLAEPHGPRVTSYKYLALAITSYYLEDYPAFDEALEQAVNVDEPRFLARKALYRVRQGRFQDAAEIRTRIRWFGEDPEPHPLVKIVDAEIAWATGFAEEALETIGDEPGLRAAMVRGRALFDLGRYEKAVLEFDAALEIAPEHLWAQIWGEASRMLAADSTKVRRKADRELDSLGRKAQSKAGRIPHGIALMKSDKLRIARDKLEATLRDMTEQYPNPLAYRSHVALAELDLREEKTEEALEHVEKALEQVGGYLPAEDLKCRLLAPTDPEAAYESCRRVVEEERASPGAELAWVQTIMPSDDPEARDAAIAAIKRAKDAGAPVEELQAAIAETDPELFEELEVPEPEEEED